NVSRTIGPALGGVIIATIGIAAPFWLDAASSLAVLAALVLWHPRTKAMSNLPAERSRCRDRRSAPTRCSCRTFRLPRIEAYCRSVGVDTMRAEIQDIASLREAISTFKGSTNGALIIMPDPFTLI